MSPMREETTPMRTVDLPSLLLRAHDLRELGGSKYLE